MSPGKLYLIPNLLGEGAPDMALPPGVLRIVAALDEFIVENERNARRFLSRLGHPRPIRELVFHTLDQHTAPRALATYLAGAEAGCHIGFISEAGCPGVADPGQEMVALAHRKGIAVVPLVGPSSILLALMASGFNGQRFAFHGYLPIKAEERTQAIRQMEQDAYRKDQTQIFMETPYRNNQLLNDVVALCQPETRLCVAADLTLPTESVSSRTIGQWRKSLPDLHQRPAMFLLYR
jgi:16S rRNA (cytidine1402-2'-O)-methyltransferase